MIVYGSAAAQPSPLAVTPGVSRQLIGPGGGQVEGTQDSTPAVSPGTAVDAALSDLDARVSALEHGEAGAA